MVKQDNWSTSGSHKTWVDDTMRLPAGWLDSAYVYIHQDMPAHCPFRLQLWTPVPDASNYFTLVYEHLFLLSNVHGIHSVSTG